MPSNTHRIRFGLLAGGMALAASSLLATTAQAQTWVDWTAVTTAGAAGTLDASGTDVGVALSGPVYFGQTSCGTDYFASGSAYAGVANRPGCDMVAINAVSSYTVNFTNPIANLYMAFISVGQPNLPVTYSFNAPFGIISEGAGWFGSGPAVVTGNQLTGNEWHGIIRFDAPISSLSFSTAPGETWHGFTFGTDGLAPPPNTVTPEPISMALLGTGLLGVGAARRRRRNQT